MKKNKWTATEVAILQEWYPKGGWKLAQEKLFAQGFKRPKSGIQSKASELDLRTTSFWWSPEEEDMLKEAYIVGGIKLATQALKASGFCRSKNAVKVKARVLKIRSIDDGRFKKGHTSANKGQKMSPAQREQASLNWSKKGEKPQNALHDGAITIRKGRNNKKYKYIRIASNVWVQYHRYLWKAHYGAIPHRLVVYFKDGNTLNCDLDNFGLRTRADSLKSNIEANGGLPATVLTDNYVRCLLKRSSVSPEIITPELIDLKRIQILLKREIEKNGNNT